MSAAAEASTLNLDTIDITGPVTTLYCQRPTFSAGVMVVKGLNVKFAVKGYVTAGEPTTLRGRYETDPKFGKQFKATEVVYAMPADLDGLRQWLMWYGAGVGPVKANRMVDEFGMDLMRLVVEDAGQVAACASVPIKSIEELAATWVKHSGKVSAASQLAAWGLTQRETEALLGQYGGGVVKLIQDDPFVVFGVVDGFGWKNTDSLAAKVGVVGSDPRRLRGAVSAVVRERYDEGSTATLTSLACAMAADKIGALPEVAERVAATITAAVERRQLKLIEVDDGKGGAAASWLSTVHGFNCESLVWRVLNRSREKNPCIGSDDDEKLRSLAAEYTRLPVGGATFELDAGQVGAVFNAARYKISVVTGGAGAGKTLVARAITKLFLDGDEHVWLAAPTGKAARRLEEVIGREASTIHRLLEYSGLEGRFTRNKDNPLGRGVVILDEVSMADAPIMYAVLSALGKYTSLVLIGDQNQLPPVGPGAVLRDILAHDLAPITALQKCHRQAGTLKVNCNAILHGKVEPWANDETPSPWVVSRQCNTAAKVLKVVEDLYVKYLPEWGYDPIRDTQFMVAKHDGPLGTRRLNLVLQRLHQRKLGNELGEIGEDQHEEKPTLYTNDKAIQNRNDYELEVMNGTLGIVVDTHPALVVSFDGKVVTYPKAKEKDVSLGYCLTPHRMQGSEVPCAVTIVPKANAFMQTRQWFYTATTRAKRTSVIIGDDEGIRRAAEKVDIDRRSTLLQVFAQNEGTRP